MYTPKPMLPVAGVPFVAHQLARLRDAGVRRVVLATSYRAEVFEGYLGDGAGLGMELEYATEDEPLGTGGAIRNGVQRLSSGPDDPVVVLNGDILSGHDVAGQVRTHRDSRRGRHAAPGPGRRPAGVRLRADRRRRSRHRSSWRRRPTRSATR